MSGTAQIYDAVLHPTKEEFTARFGAVVTLLGSYRLVDPADEVGIEIHIGRDGEGRLVQMPTTYRAEELDPAATFCSVDHSVLGTRWVSNALGDPVAVAQIIRTIVQGDDGAAYSNDSGPIVDVLGTGDPKAPEGEPGSVVEDLEVGKVKLQEYTRQRAVGTVEIGDHVRSFELRLPNLLQTERTVARGFTTPRMHLTATPKDERLGTDDLIVAELYWGDLVKEF